MSTPTPKTMTGIPAEAAAVRQTLGALPLDIGDELGLLVDSIENTKGPAAAKATQLASIKFAAHATAEAIAVRANTGRLLKAQLMGVVDTLVAAGHTDTDADNLSQTIGAILQRLGAYHQALEANSSERQDMRREIGELQQTILSMAVELHGPEPVQQISTADRPQKSPRKARG